MSNEASTATRVMVIDDSQTIRRTAETLLAREGYEVVTAQDGFEALSKISDNRPDIIFIDIMMPRLDGYQACALIKNNPRPIELDTMAILIEAAFTGDRTLLRAASTDRKASLS